jgi:hypothetical protein
MNMNLSTTNHDQEAMIMNDREFWYILVGTLTP